MRYVPFAILLFSAACASTDADLALAPPPTSAAMAVTSEGTTLPELDKPLRLEDLLPLLLERNPGVRAARAKLEAAAERYPQAIALPDPMVETAYYARNAMDTSNSFPRYDLEIRQEFPFPTVLSLRGDVATKEAQAEALRYEAALRDAVTELKDVHAERAYLAGAARVQAAIRDVYRRYAELARGEVTSGRTRLPEAFRAEALLAQAGYELTLVEEVKGVEDQRLRALLALGDSVKLGEPADGTPAADLDLDLKDLARRALEHNQELRAAGVEAEAADIGVRLARWNRVPVFSIGAAQMVNDDFDPATGVKNDSTVITFGFTLPIWAKKAGIREAEARSRAAWAMESGERERIAADVARLGFRVRNAARLAVLYGRELVPQAEKALTRSQSMMQEGKETLSSSLELAATWQQLRIAELRAIADEAQALAALERALGTSIEATPAPAADGAPR